MIALAFSLATVSHHHRSPGPANGRSLDERCAIGAAVLRDAASLDGSYKAAEKFVRRGSLVETCPNLLTALPPGWHVADAAAEAAAATIFPMAHTFATIFSIGMPVIAPDGRHATVNFGYGCNPPCGAEYVLRYVKGPTGWVLDSKRGLYVS